MKCNNVKCPYYQKPAKPDAVDILVGDIVKVGGCAKPWCKLQERNKRK